jgi:hypothetical protein
MAYGTTVKTATIVISTLLGGAGLLLAGGSGAKAQQNVVQGLAGAWVQDGTSCSDVFAWKGGRASYKKPIDAFAPAFLVSGQNIQGPQASCRISRRKP